MLISMFYHIILSHWCLCPYHSCAGVVAIIVLALLPSLCWRSHVPVSLPLLQWFNPCCCGCNGILVAVVALGLLPLLGCCLRCAALLSFCCAGWLLPVALSPLQVWFLRIPLLANCCVQPLLLHPPTTDTSGTLCHHMPCHKQASTALPCHQLPPACTTTRRHLNIICSHSLAQGCWWWRYKG